MTNKEAISVIENRLVLPGYGDSYGSVCEADYIREAIDTAIAALKSEPKWIGVKERLPDKNGQYMVLLRRTASKEFGGNRREIKIIRWLGCEWKLPYHIPAWINEQIKDEVTHWMPLPQKPKEEIE